MNNRRGRLYFVLFSVSLQVNKQQGLIFSKTMFVCIIFCLITSLSHTLDHDHAPCRAGQVSSQLLGRHVWSNQIGVISAPNRGKYRTY